MPGYLFRSLLMSVHATKGSGRNSRQPSTGSVSKLMSFNSKFEFSCLW